MKQVEFSGLLDENDFSGEKAELFSWQSSCFERETFENDCHAPQHFIVL